jgi:haloacid dehalogenase superfamily, subfamily IA, variant 1 with third motif having Dx(3-4)D or Dx(3-4)E
LGHQQKKLSDIKKLAGRGAWIMMQRSFKEEIKDEKLKNDMTKEFLNFYSKNIDSYSKPINGIEKFLSWAKNNNISMAICTNKQEKLAIDLIKKLKLNSFFEYIAGSDTFPFNKPDPRHLTNVVEILGGSLKKTIMVGDSEVDSQSAISAEVPFILVENGYTEKNKNEIKHNDSIKDFINFELIIKKYL